MKYFGGKPTHEQLESFKQSPNFKNRKFVNMVPTNVMEPGSFLKSMRFQFFGDEKRNPSEPPPTVQTRISDFVGGDQNSVRAVWIGHASVLLKIDNYIILTDPVWSDRVSPSKSFGPKRFFVPPIALSDLPKVDVVVVSHDHYDHLDMDTVIELAKTGTQFVVPLGVGSHLKEWGISNKQYAELDWFQEFKMRELTILLTPARHYSGRGPLGAFSGNDTLWTSFVMKTTKHRAFYSGDTGYMEEFKKIGMDYGPFDLTMIKIGAYGPTWPDVHVNPEEALKIHQDLNGTLFLPVHWGTFNLAYHDWNEPAVRLIRAAQKMGIKITIPKPGQIVDIKDAGFIEEWWL